MATREDILKQVGEVVEQSAEKFNNKLSTFERKIMDEVGLLIKDLDVKGDKISATVKNVRLISSITNKLKKLFLTNEYKDHVKEFIKAFNSVTTLQNQYFKTLESDFKPSAVLQAIREQAIDSVLEQLTEVNLSQLASRVKGILQRNITTGGVTKLL